MTKRKFGNTSELIAPIGLGCMGMSGIYGQADDNSSIDTLNRALEIGCNFWDTADAYGAEGHNEKLIGKALKGKRDKVFLSTKFGLRRLPNMPAPTIDGSPAYIKTAVENSLKRLDTDYIDLYFQHRVDQTIPVEETVGAMADLVKEGKVKYIGLSEASANTIRRAVKVHPINALQTEYSLWTLDIENEILQTCKDLDIAVVAYSPIGRGFLSGSIKKLNELEDNDWRKSTPRMQENNFKDNLLLVKEIEQLAKEKNCTSSQLALAWLLHQGENIFPIPGTKRIKYLEENFAANKISLTAEELKKIRLILNSSTISGARYPEQFMDALNR
jgi:aryl-alcohol dehydrogenase-like predicted oxidoreductase